MTIHAVEHVLSLDERWRVMSLETRTPHPKYKDGMSSTRFFVFERQRHSPTPQKNSPARFFVDEHPFGYNMGHAHTLRCDFVPGTAKVLWDQDALDEQLSWCAPQEGERLVCDLWRNFRSLDVFAPFEHLSHPYAWVSLQYNDGYGVLDLITGQVQEVFDGREWFWLRVKDYQAGRLMVVGCVWSGPIETATFDARNPLDLPYRLIRQENTDETEPLHEMDEDEKVFFYDADLDREMDLS